MNFEAFRCIICNQMCFIMTNCNYFYSLNFSQYSKQDTINNIKLLRKLIDKFFWNIQQNDTQKNYNV